MDGVYNRKLFAKKSEEARNKLRQMGGVQPMAPQGGGILASSPELMQAVAMRQPVVLPRSQAPAPMAQPMPAPMTQMLPPSQPIPNIAGIQQGSAPMAPTPRPAPRPMAPAPRPMAQKPGVAKFNEGGSALANHYMTPKLQSQLKKSTGMPFDKAFEFGQTAITTEDPAKLGLPKGADMAAPAKMLENPEAAAAEIIKDVVPEDQQTGDTKKDLVKAAVSTGIESVPAEAEIDQLNRAIFGAKLAGAISGSYVNPQTGQEIRPTLGARMSQAAVEGLAVERETAQRRAEQEAALAQARATAAGESTKPGKGWFDTAEGKYFTKLVQSALPLVGGSNLGAAYDRVAQEHPELVARARMEISGMGGAPDVVDRPKTSANPPPEGRVATDTRSGKTVGELPYKIGQTATDPSTGETLVFTEAGWQAM